MESSKKVEKIDEQTETGRRKLNFQSGDISESLDEGNTQSETRNNADDARNNRFLIGITNTHLAHLVHCVLFMLSAGLCIHVSAHFAHICTQNKLR